MNLCEFPANIYLFKVTYTDPRDKCEICSKLAIKTLERRRRSDVFIVNFEHQHQLTGFCMMGTLVVKGLILEVKSGNDPLNENHINSHIPTLLANRSYCQKL